MFRLFLLMVPFALFGCSRSNFNYVEGTVMLDGKPLPDASVQFIPQGTGKQASGMTDAQGKFVMSTIDPKDGVEAGTYKVTINPPVAPADTTEFKSTDEAMAAAAKAATKKKSGPSFPEEYTRPDKTPLTQEVPVKNKLEFSLKSK